MRLFFTLLLSVAAAGCSTASQDARTSHGDAASEPVPTLALHPFLQGLLGEWVGESDIHAVSGGDPVDLAGVSVFTPVGSWIVGEGTVVHENTTLKAYFSIGYNAMDDRFQATWIDSTYPFVWVYDGDLDETGTVLTLECEGPSKFSPDERAHFREVLTFDGPDHRFHESYVSADGAEWHRIVAAKARRQR